MAQSIPLITPVQGRIAERADVGAKAVPWYIWSSLIAVASGAFGGTWDISWHESVGRDTFWTAPHMMIYLCGVLGGLTAGYLILSTTFQKDSPLRESSISMWGFRGSLGAFICAWGGVAMITSAPFDNWWHSAYGLDVKILSPPHTLLALGMTGIRFGTLLMILSEMNRASGEYRARLGRVLLVASLFLLGMTLGMAQELTHRFYMHGGFFYLVVMITAPIWMTTMAWATESRWAATLMTGMYTAIHLAFCWLLPLAPAVPKLGPVYQKITHLVPPDFPLLVIVSAVVFDLLRRRIGNWGRWMQAAVLGAVFLATFVAVQWPFASFLMSPAANNWIFVTHNYPYAVPDSSPWVRNMFVPTEHTAAGFWVNMVLALVVAVLAMRVGMGWGAWMRRVKR
jgi:hypothetical protein